MEKITNLSHSKETFLYATSRVLERASYYGLRAIIVLYMVDSTIKMNTADATNVYGSFTAAFTLSHIIGALLGDLLIGNRRAIIIGGIVQAIGAFCLCNPSTTGLYLGLFLVVLGGGLFTPNLISNFGKLYLDKTKLLDSGFTLLYFIVNIGSFFGTISIGYIGDSYGWNYGFALAGITMLSSLIPILLSKSKTNKTAPKNNASNRQRNINIAIALVSVSLFWACHALNLTRSLDIQIQFSDISALGISVNMWSTISSAVSIPIGLIAIILWTYFYSTSTFKIMVGFISGAISFGLLLMTPDVPQEQHIILYILSLLFLSISEICIAPLAHSILTKYSNPKYLAILISLVFIPTRLLTILIGSLYGEIYGKPFIAVLTGMIIMSILSIGFIIYNQIEKQTSFDQ